jgi:glyoxylase-like metal-dependent hydrolase (beta-lactamase superfamily II)
VAPAEKTLHGEVARFAGGWHEVADQTHAYLQPNGGLGESNSGLIHDGEHVMFVDSLWDLKLTRKMLEGARKIVDAEPELLFNTHSDGDHVWGNELFTGAKIVSTSTARSLMRLDPPWSMRVTRGLGSAFGLAGSLPLPLIGTRDYGSLPRLPLKDMGREMAPFDWSNIKLTLPDETFDGRLEVAVGSRAVELIEVGPAHTLGDAVAWVPDCKVCFAADILFIGGTPIMWAGPIASWSRALETISGLGAKTFVPGHGPICTQAEVDLLRDYFAWLEAEALPRLGRGEAAAKVAESMLLSDEFASSPWGAWDDPARLVATLTTEQFRRDGGEGQLGGAGRSRAVAKMQLTKTKLARRRAGSA